MNPNNIEVLRAAARILNDHGFPDTSRRVVDVADELESEGV